jgi:hypothetical protein
MDLSDLINQLGSITISNSNDIISKIIMYMYESAEEGKHNYKYYFRTTDNVNLIIDNLVLHFPDIDIKSESNYIFIDWS